MIIYFYFDKTKSCNYQTQIPEVKYFLSVQKQCMTPQRQAMCPFKLFVTTIKTCTEVKEKLESENIKSCTLKHDYEGHQCYSILLVRTGFVTEPKAKLYRCYPWSSTWLCHRPAHLLLYCFTRSVLCMREHALGFTKAKKMGLAFHEAWVSYLHTLLHLNPTILVIVHHLMDAPQGLQAVAIGLAHTWRRHHHTRVYMDQEINVIISIIMSLKLAQLKILDAFHLKADYKWNTFLCIITALFLADTRTDCLTLVFFDFWLIKG